MIQALTTRELRGNCRVDFALAQSVDGERRPAYDWQPLNGGRVVTLVGAAHELVSRADRAGYLGGGGEEGDNTRHAGKSRLVIAQNPAGTASRRPRRCRKQRRERASSHHERTSPPHPNGTATRAGGSGHTRESNRHVAC